MDSTLWSVIARRRKEGVCSRRRGLPAAGASEPSPELILIILNREVSDILYVGSSDDLSVSCLMIDCKSSCLPAVGASEPLAGLHLTILKSKISDI